MPESCFLNARIKWWSQNHALMPESAFTSWFFLQNKNLPLEGAKNLKPESQKLRQNHKICTQILQSRTPWTLVANPSVDTLLYVTAEWSKARNQEALKRVQIALLTITISFCYPEYQGWIHQPDISAYRWDWTETILAWQDVIFGLMHQGHFRLNPLEFASG